MPTVPHTGQKSHNKSSVPPTSHQCHQHTNSATNQLAVPPSCQQYHHHTNSAIIMPTVPPTSQQCQGQSGVGPGKYCTWNLSTTPTYFLLSQQVSFKP
ncbi:hypothetical protein Pcinc_011734, partial [Petrolisthes cinctipes]